jgi:hypothetical protein
MNRTEVIEARGKPNMKLGRFVSEFVAPAAVFTVLLPAFGIRIGSVASFAIMLCSCMVASALKVYAVNETQARFEEQNALGEFYVAAAVFYATVAFGVAMLFELITT